MRLRPIQPGDTIAFVTPASPLPAERLEFMTRLLEEEGYRVKLAPHALDNDGGYLAGTDEERAADLTDAFDDPDVAAVMCTRGGYGCARLLPYLDLDHLAAAGKAMLGFSDVTTLHVALNRRGTPSIHSPMPLTLSYPREAWVYESFKRVLRGDLEFPPEAPPMQTVHGGIAEGEVVGGCLILLADGIGTPEQVDTEGKILVIEGVDDPSHRVDAMLTHLLNAGILGKCAGIVIGEMTRADERADEAIGRKHWRDIVRERLDPLGIPAVVDFPFGHFRSMLTVPLGIRARLDADAGTLTYTEPLFESR